MPRLWTANKNYTDSLNANTRYLVGAANGGCNYQTIPAGSTKRVLHGAAGGTCYYGNETIPIPDPNKGNVDMSAVVARSYIFAGYNPTGGTLSARALSWDSTLYSMLSTDFDLNTSTASTDELHFSCRSGNYNDLANVINSVKRIRLFQLVNTAWVERFNVTISSWDIYGTFAQGQVGNVNSVSNVTAATQTRVSFYNS